MFCMALESSVLVSGLLSLGLGLAENVLIPSFDIVYCIGLERVGHLF